MKAFDELLAVADRLLGPDGCSWDKKQTLHTLQPYLLEETHELIEAIDLGDGEKIRGEVGDVLYNLIFISKLAESKEMFSMEDAVRDILEKLIRRHPHVFADVQVSSNEEIVKNWDEIKKKEKGSEGRKGLFDGIPPSLPTLPRAQKMAQRLRKAGDMSSADEVGDEAELGEALWRLIRAADKRGLDAESALRRYLKGLQE